MSITIRERPKQKSTLDPKRPGSVREYAADGSNEKIEIQLAAMAYIPLFDAQIDSVTGLPITLFRGTLDIQEAGGGTWNITAPFESSQNTVELNFTFSVQSTNIKQSIRTVKAYSCLQVASLDTRNQCELTTGDALLCDNAADAIDAAIVTVGVLRAFATGLNSVLGVDEGVHDLVAAAITAAFEATSEAAEVSAKTRLTASDTRNAVQATLAGDVAGADTSADAAQDDVEAVHFHVIDVEVANDDCDEAASAADIAASGSDADTIAAAAAAVSLAAGVAALFALCTAAEAAAHTAADGADSCVDALTGDQRPGSNGIPDFKRAIGVNGEQVEGVEIEVAKLEWSLTKKWALGTLSGEYLQLLAEWTDRCMVNDADFTILWQGQTLTFKMGTLRFRCATVKWNNSNELEIVYHFAYSRSIRAQDDYHLGLSGLITKEGWEHIWVRYRQTVSAGTTVFEPQAAYIEQVYPKDDFNKLKLDAA